DDVSSSSSYVIWGSGNQSIMISYNKPFFGYIFGASLSGNGCSQNGLFFQCTSSTTLNISSAGFYRLVLVGEGINSEDIVGGDRKYLLGTKASLSEKTGKGVVIGIIDSGINFCHPAFRNPDGTTRVLFYRDYTGVELNASQINSMINNGVCNYDSEGHGTAVAGVAGGYWASTRYNSPAKDAKFIIYKTNLLDTDVMMGLDYIKSKAQSLNMPAVVNLSLGGHLDPHDGTGLLDRYIDQVSGPGFVVVVSAGNEGSDRIHARITSSSGNVGISASSVDIEGWYTRGSSYRVQVCDQSGTSCVSAEPGNIANAQVGSTLCFAYVDNRTLSSPLNGDGQLYIQVSCTNPTNLILRLTRLSSSGIIDMWLEGNGKFTNGQVDDGFGGFSYTVSSPGTAKSAITVGAIGANYIGSSYFDNYGRIAFFSSRGPTRDNRIKPDVVADGYFQCTANANFSNTSNPNLCGSAGSGSYYVAMAGTSFSAPAVVSLIAMYMQDHPSADPIEVKNWLTGNALYDTEGTAPNIAYGYGKAVWKETPLSTGSSGGSGGGCSMVSSGSPVSLFAWLLILVVALLRKRFFISVS
ncbi:MAG: S8 family serine peptidase, partial [Hydrogenobacter sp.]